MYLKNQIRILNEVLRPTKQAQALRESKIMFAFLVQISMSLVSEFLMAYYLHYAWALLFGVLLVVGALVFYFWYKKTDSSM